MNILGKQVIKIYLKAQQIFKGLFIMQMKIDRITYTSDGKRKSSNFTLRNLLSENLVQNNFVSLHSERVGSPNKALLHYPDRVRQKLYPETVRVIKRKNLPSRQNPIIDSKDRKIQSPTRNVRVMSSCPESRFVLGQKCQSQGLLVNQQTIAQVQYSKAATIRQTFRPMSIKKQSKIKMKKLLGRVEFLARKQVVLEDSEQVMTIFQFLQALSETENYYQQVFAYITSKLSSMIFLPLLNESNQQMAGFNRVTEITKNPHLISAIYSNTQPSTYKGLLDLFIQQIINLSETMKKQQHHSLTENQSIRSVIKEKEELIRKLTQKLNYYQSHPSQNKYPQLEQFKQQNKLLKSQLQEQIYQIKILTHNLQLLHQHQILYENKIHSLKAQIARYQLQKQSLQKVEKSSELKIFQDNVGMLKQMLDRSIIRMSGMKEQYDKLKNYNQILINQRDILSKRAAVGFGQLTPRPNLKKIFQNHNMNINQVFDPEITSSRKNPISTQKFVDTLIKKFKDYYETYKLQQKQPKKAKKSVISKQKLKQKQVKKDVFERVMDEVYETKQQINRTLESVEGVKNACSKIIEGSIKNETSSP